MNKLILTIFLSLFLMGCSMIPRITFDSPNSVPQSIEKGKTKSICKGEVKLNEMGEIIYCSKGYYNYEEDFNKQERKMTIIEKIKSYINALSGWGFIIFVALVIFCPSALGFIFGRVIEAVAGIGSKALKSTVKAIQKARKDGKDLSEALSAEQDKDVKKYIAKLKEQENIK